jgi:nucleoid-associated protein YgaU
VEAGDTPSRIAQKYDGDASLYVQVFEANRDRLKNPDLIKVGQTLRIP